MRVVDFITNIALYIYFNATVIFSVDWRDTPSGRLWTRSCRKCCVKTSWILRKGRQLPRCRGMNTALWCNNVLLMGHSQLWTTNLYVQSFLAPFGLWSSNGQHISETQQQVSSRISKTTVMSCLLFSIHFRTAYYYHCYHVKYRSQLKSDKGWSFIRHFQHAVYISCQIEMYFCVLVTVLIDNKMRYNK